MGHGSSISIGMIFGFQPIAKYQQIVNHLFDPDLTVDKLIHPTTHKWNMQVISTLVEPNEAALIGSILICRPQLMDKDGWYFTQSGKYTVKSA